MMDGFVQRKSKGSNVSSRCLRIREEEWQMTVYYEEGGEVKKERREERNREKSYMNALEGIQRDK